MALPRISRTDERVRIVYAGDLAVTPKDPDAGCWIKASAAHLRDDADVLTVSGLNMDQRDAAVDAGGNWQICSARCRAGVRAVNGSDDPIGIEEFLEEIEDIPRFQLGLYIKDITDGVDPDPGQRRSFRRQSQLEAREAREAGEPVEAGDPEEGEGAS